MTSKLRHAAFNTDYFRNVIADYQKPKKLRIGYKSHKRKKVSRCPGCGGMVTKPCVACKITFIGEHDGTRLL